MKRRRNTGGMLSKQMKSAERAVILRVLEECDGNATRAAEQLGIARQNLELKISEHGLRTWVRSVRA